ncbi:Nuclear cap-binding protein subunit 1 [Acorus gramineus]|uniref:Nuclear cap-binding protein subunit 1 n=1 Tax=Acorus gramineus TaxID=55184 RepID=A0AAV9BUL0_ACOGR|nr:Nuclear cap-binding protein subunit 1 [Acorus gramineus]
MDAMSDVEWQSRNMQDTQGMWVWDEIERCGGYKTLARAFYLEGMEQKVSVGGEMSVWRSHLLRIGDRCPEYGLGNVDFKEHIDACCSVVFRELEHSGEDILKVRKVHPRKYGHHLQKKYGISSPFADPSLHVDPLLEKTVIKIGLINLENEDFVKRILEITQINLQDAISSEKCDQIRVLIRFLAALQIPEMIEEVMVGIQSYLSIRKHVHDTGVTFFEIGEGNDKTLDEKDFLEDLWVRVQSMSNDGWKVDSVPRPHLTFEAQLVGGISHGIGPIICHEPPVFPSLGVDDGKQKHEAELRYPQRLRRLNIFPSSKSEVVHSS